MNANIVVVLLNISLIAAVFSAIIIPDFFFMLKMILKFGVHSQCLAEISLYSVRVFSDFSVVT